MADINLVTEEQKQYEGLESLRKKLSVAAVIMLVFTAVATLGTLTYFTSLVSARRDLIARIDESSAKVDSFRTVEELAVVVKEKISVAEQIIDGRSDKVKFFNSLAQLVPQNVAFGDLKLSQGRVTISGSAKTSNDIAAFVSALVSSRGAEVISQVSVDALSSGDNGTYTFGISGSVAGK